MVFSCGRSPEFTTRRSRRRASAHLIICGVETHVCVLQTAMDLAREGYRIHVPADAVTSRRDLDWKLGLELMQKAGAEIGTPRSMRSSYSSAPARMSSR